MFVLIRRYTYIPQKDRWYLQSHVPSLFAYNVAIATVLFELKLRPRAIFVSKIKLINPYGERSVSRRAYSDHAWSKPALRTQALPVSSTLSIATTESV